MSEPVQTEHVIADVPCPFCECLCDDLQLTVAGRRIIAADNACEFARPLFLTAGAAESRPCRIAGQTATLDAAILRAAEILQRARYPLVWGLGRATCEAQAAAVELAERLGGVVDTSTADASQDGNLEALQTLGEITCTLGEVQSRGDLVVIWNADPLTTHPRFFERYAPQSLANGGECSLIVVDSRLTATAAAAGQHLRIRAGSEFESATALWALAKGFSLDPAIVAKQTGVPLAQWQALLTSLERSRYSIILYDDARGGPSFVPPLFGLIRTLNDRARCVCLRLGEVSNGAGAEQVLTWRTGFPRCIDLSQGYPRYNPTDFAAERMLERGEVDAALVLCDDPEIRLSAAAQARLQEIPTVLIDWKDPPVWLDPDVSIRVAVPGVESGGTMFRMDGVPLALRPAIASSDPADFKVLRMLTIALDQRAAS